MNNLYYKILIILCTSLTLNAHIQKTNQIIHTLKRFYSSSSNVSNQIKQKAIKRLLKMSYDSYCKKMNTDLPIKISNYTNQPIGGVIPEEIDTIIEKEYCKELTRDYLAEKTVLTECLTDTEDFANNTKDQK